MKKTLCRCWIHHDGKIELLGSGVVRGSDQAWPVLMKPLPQETIEKALWSLIPQFLIAHDGRDFIATSLRAQGRSTYERFEFFELTAAMIRSRCNQPDLSKQVIALLERAG